MCFFLVCIDNKINILMLENVFVCKLNKSSDIVFELFKTQKKNSQVKLNLKFKH